MEIAEQLQGQLGPVDILVVNAGIAGPDTPAEQMIDEAWQRIFDVNLNLMHWVDHLYPVRPTVETA